LLRSFRQKRCALFHQAAIPLVGHAPRAAAVGVSFVEGATHPPATAEKARKLVAILKPKILNF
jgi:hypothetical protein